MNIEEIRKGAPSGSTHYRLRRHGGICYYKFMFDLHLALDGSFRFSMKHDSIKPLY